MVHSLDLIRGSSPNVTVHAVAQLSTNSISVKLWDSANAILAVFVEDNPDSRRNSVTHVLSAIMFGDIAPSARLPFTLWRSPFAAHTCYSSYFNPMPRLLNDFKEWFRQSQSEEDQNPARLPFGFGMTYGFFWFSNLTASVNRTHATAVVQVKNKSQTQARISVLLFSAALPRGALRLRRFVKLNPMGYGDEREVRFDVPLAEILEKQEPFHGNEITLRIADLEQRIRIGT
ncbi:hypothetical protein BJ742DRAFT_843249 [Cladochytrium replicatum]|nr:hypothetical protein BJ742DRAFT_843249 [Cladochytrium replicatum]